MMEKATHGPDGYRVPRSVIGLDGDGDIIMRPSIDFFVLEAENRELREESLGRGQALSKATGRITELGGALREARDRLVVWTPHKQTETVAKIDTVLAGEGE